jgi:ornithine cyclodeaminase/alanine dehydrogenase-like protein (mu-crystallin family)
MGELLVVDRETVSRLLPLQDCIPLMRQAMTALSAGRTRQLLRQIIDLGDGRLFGVMPGADEEAFGAKLISVFPGNAARGLQSHQGFVVLFDPQTGQAVCVLHGGEITAIRTAAASAAATAALARPDARRLAVLGTGEQAWMHARAIPHVRPIEELRLWGRSQANAEALAARLGPELKLSIRVCGTVREAAQDADVICTTTSASEPVLQGAWVADGAHVNLVGSSYAGPREVDDALVARARLFADHREGVLRQGAEVLHAIQAGLIGEDHVLGEIGEVMSGRTPGRLSPADVTAYKSLGAIVQDLVSGWQVYQRAMEKGAGVRAAF